jgi:hypothetical protein
LAVYGPPAKELNQGDVLRDVPFLKRRKHDVELIVAPGLVTSHSCDIDKFESISDRNARLRFPLTVAPVVGLDTVDAEVAGNVRADKHRRFFYLPREGPFSERMVDRWWQQPIPLVLLRELKREATLSDEHLARLWEFDFVSFSRRDPKRVFIGGTLAT